MFGQQRWSDGLGDDDVKSISKRRRELKSVCAACRARGYSANGKMGQVTAEEEQMAGQERMEELTSGGTQEPVPRWDG